MTILLLVANLISLGFIWFFSYYYLYTVQVREINENMTGLAEEERIYIEKVLNDLNSASQMLDIYGGLGRDVVDFFREKDRYQQAYLFQDVNRQLANIYLTNSDLGAVFYYFPDFAEPVQFGNFKTSIEFDPEKLPLFYQANLLTYYGPHPSMNPMEKSMVFSLLRKMEDENGKPFYSYLETKLGSQMEKLFPDQVRGISVTHGIMNSQGELIFPGEADASVFGNHPEYRLIKEKSKAGWEIVIAIRQSDYAEELLTWRVRFLAIASGALLVNFFMAWLIWKLVNKPLGQMRMVVSSFISNMPEVPETEFELIEFQNLYNTFQEAQTRIEELTSEIEQRGKLQSQLETEKLLAQINPHFIHNTLNTIQWLARAQGNSDIVKLVSIFTRVLHYNMGKKSLIVTVEEEIAAVKDYLELQSIRYDYVFQYQIQVEPGTECVPLPRFVLQPLVENAIFHGVENGRGQIEIEAHWNGEDQIQLIVRDDGKGIEPDQLEKIQANSDTYRRFGMGIGLGYVRKMIDTYYGNTARFEIDSQISKGTCISILVPVIGPVSIQ